MILAELLPQSSLTQTYDIMMNDNDDRKSESKMTDEKSESTMTDKKSDSITAIKIPLVSFEPTLATSPKYILVNEFTKRKNQFVLFDDHLQRFPIRSPIKQGILDALWYEKQEYFLILTSTNIFTLDPNSKEINLLKELIPIENQIFKCFILLNPSTLLIAYDQWSAKYIDKWKQNEDGLWILIERQPLQLTENEFIGNMIINNQDNYTHLAITIYNDLTNQWRIELRHAETFLCHKKILLPGTNMAHDYRIISINNAESNIKWLVFLSGDSNIIAIDSQWKKITLKYKNPVQRMALFNENYLIVRTTERIDIYLYV